MLAHSELAAVIAKPRRQLFTKLPVITVMMMVTMMMVVTVVVIAVMVWVVMVAVASVVRPCAGRREGHRRCQKYCSENFLQHSFLLVIPHSNGGLMRGKSPA